MTIWEILLRIGLTQKSGRKSCLETYCWNYWSYRCYFWGARAGIIKGAGSVNTFGLILLDKNYAAIGPSYTVGDIEKLVDYTYSYKDQCAAISSGSFPVDGIIVAPCSMKTLASIRIGLADNLLTRAADVILKERKKLVLLTQETSLNNKHLENMLELSRMGTIILPPHAGFL